MKIQVIGRGVVGTATGEGFRRFGHEVTYTDKGDAHRSVEADVRFICTPEDTVPEVVKALVEWRPQRQSTYPGTLGLELVPNIGIVVIRSSVPPGTTLDLSSRYKVPLVHNPEFLREAVAGYEFLDSGFAIVGGDGISWREARHVAGALYEPMGKRVVICCSIESEFLKLALNCYLATQVSFWNQIKLVADRLNLNSHLIARLALNDPRVSRYGAVQHGAPYGGTCLPKDLAHMLDMAAQIGAPSHLLRAVAHINHLLEEKPCASSSPERPASSAPSSSPS